MEYGMEFVQKLNLLYLISRQALLFKRRFWSVVKERSLKETLSGFLKWKKNFKKYMINICFTLELRIIFYILYHVLVATS